MQISVHIPKCAGTSFKHVLREIHGRGLWTNYGNDFTAAAVPFGTTCVHGHFAADAYASVWPAAKLLTVVRHPVQRLVSNYYHFMRRPDPLNPASVRLHQDRLTIRQFAELDAMRNEITRYVAGRAPSDFAFVGIAERFHLSLLLLRKKFRIDCPFPEIRDNINPEKAGESYELDETTLAHLADLNSSDMEWYAAAVADFDANLRTIASDPRKQSVAVAHFVANLLL